METETGVGAADDFKEYDLDDFSTDYSDNLFKFLSISEKSEVKKKWSV